MITKIHDSGNADANCMNLVFMSDGFITSEQAKFDAAVKEKAAYFLNDSTFKKSAFKINIYSIFVASQQSGVIQPSSACQTAYGMPVSNPNTYFGSSFNIGGICRALEPKSQQQVYDFLTSSLPQFKDSSSSYGCKLNATPFIIVNTTIEGGEAVGSMGISTLSTNSNETVVHEHGHTWSGLNDEYATGDKMRAWNTDNALPPLWNNIYSGHAEHNPVSPDGWYTPTASCKMRTLGVPFCIICDYQITKSIDQLIRASGGTPAIGTTPPTKPEITGITYTPNSNIVKLTFNTLPGTAYSTVMAHNPASTDINPMVIGSKVPGNTFTHIFKRGINWEVQVSSIDAHLHQLGYSDKVIVRTYFI